MDGNVSQILTSEQGQISTNLQVIPQSHLLWISRGEHNGKHGNDPPKSPTTSLNGAVQPLTWRHFSRWDRGTGLPFQCGGGGGGRIEQTMRTRWK
ncbi:hypothetical protein CDAR_432081 [Caerostris darwini]|uniref:Uncharacterized protein n=1 Tax=Caerostris darwini TaxID=1538125 RepID=A0AAV4U2S0_9ARAC|nr:hypothetical protein CDAR_432081 [Caerostris darwini]